MISLIAALSQNRVIGKNNDLPWHLPEDLKHFRLITSGHPVIMGRKTWESIFARLKGPLPKRRNIVITSNPGFEATGAEIVTSLPEALALIPKEEEAFIIGGAQIYEQALPQADRLYLTEIAQTIEGDAFFPTFTPNQFREVSRETHKEGPTAFSFVVYEKL